MLESYEFKRCITNAQVKQKQIYKLSKKKQSDEISKKNGIIRTINSALYYRKSERTIKQQQQELICHFLHEMSAKKYEFVKTGWMKKKFI